jgi:CHAD domain-containing protein
MMTANVENTLVISLDERWNVYRAQFKTCRQAFSEEAVHDLRVAARRLMAVLDIVRAIDPHPRIRKTRRFLKDQLDDLDDLRDVQVMLVEVSETIERLPKLRSFQEYLQKREIKLLHSALKQVKTSKPSVWGKRNERIRTALEKEVHKPDFQGRLLQAVDNVYLRTNQAYDQMDGAQAATIHRVRIAFKKFRYMAEIVLPMLPGYPESQFKRMHDYQSAMGDIQDMEIFLNTFTEFAESRPQSSEKDAAAIDLRPIRRFYRKRHTELVAAYFEDKGELSTFWRPATDQTFPWEKSNDPLHHPSRNRRTGGEPRQRRRRQPATVNGRGPKEDAQDRKGIEGTGSSARPDPDQSLPAGGADGEDPGKEVRHARG